MADIQSLNNKLQDSLIGMKVPAGIDCNISLHDIACGLGFGLLKKEKLLLMSFFFNQNSFPKKEKVVFPKLTNVCVSLLIGGSMQSQMVSFNEETIDETTLAFPYEDFNRSITISDISFNEEKKI